MNYYDLSNPSTPPTRGYRLGLWRLRRQRIYRILVVLAAILTYILLYLTLKRDDYTNDMLKAIVLLFCSVAVFLALLLVARNRIDVVRMRKREVQERHDYNYAMYRTLYKKKEKLRSITLLQMARQQIELHRPQMALQALELVKREKLNVAQLRSFYFYQAAALYLDAQESWQEALTSCYAIPQKPQQLSQEEIESLFLPESNPDKLVLAVSDWEEQKASWPVVTMLAAILILYTGVYYSVNGLLSWRYHYRDWVVYVSFFVLFFGWTVLTLYWLVKLFRLIGKQTEKGKGAKTVQKIFLVILWICLFLGNSLMQVAQIFGSDAEVEVQPNGVIEMKHENWLDPPEYYYNKATGLFFRRTLTLDEIIEYGISEETLEDDSTAHASDGETQNDSGTEEDQTTGENTTDTNIDGTTESGADTETEDPLMSQARAVYTYMKEHGEIADDGDVSQVTASCNAKGNFYAIFESGEENGNGWDNRLVYDRTSKNGECELFVYERVETGKDPQLLGFYAVNKTTGEVISGEKTSWSEVGSEAYREATGE